MTVGEAELCFDCSPIPFRNKRKKRGRTRKVVGQIAEFDGID